MEVLRETTAAEDVAALDRAWAQPPTFAFVPQKSPVAEGWVRDALAALPDDLRTDGFALLTSGSTGHPKLIVGRRERAEALVDLLHEVQEAEPVRQTILTLPLSYCYSFVNQWLWARRKERELVVTGGFGAPDRLGAALEAAEDAMLCLVGAQLALLDRHLPDAVYAGVVRLLLNSGEKQRPDDVVAVFAAEPTTSTDQ